VARKAPDSHGILHVDVIDRRDGRCRRVANPRRSYQPYVTANETPTAAEEFAALTSPGRNARRPRQSNTALGGAPRRLWRDVPFAA
jgi:hypothetical protein